MRMDTLKRKEACPCTPAPGAPLQEWVAHLQQKVQQLEEEQQVRALSNLLLLTGVCVVPY